MGRKPRFGGDRDEIVFEVCYRLIERRENADAIVTSLKAERGIEISREQVYRLVREGIDQKFVRMSAPTRRTLAERLAKGCGVGEDRIQVVAARGALANEHVAARGAEITLRLIKDLGKRRPTVHLGLGAGWTTMRLARHLAHLIREDPPQPRLVLHALSSALDPADPMRSPVAFFTFFQDMSRIDFVGLFSAAAVDVRNYERDKRLPGVAEPFARRNEIDIVVTSLGDPHHEDGSLNRFLRLSPARAAEDLRKNHVVVGEVQCMPFSAQRPVTMRSGFRAVTLFEIPELVDRAQMQDKFLLLVAAPCGKCGELKTDALRPLLTEAGLRIWTHVVVDIAQAEILAATDLREPEAVGPGRRSRAGGARTE